MSPKLLAGRLAPGQFALLMDVLLIASGADARRLKAPGSTLKNIFYMRTEADVRRQLAALSGARQVNFSIDMLDDARKVAQMMTNIELSENSDFTNNYIAALFLPHTDEKAFPSISEKISKNYKVSGIRS